MDKETRKRELPEVKVSTEKDELEKKATGVHTC